ncbi:outer membrane beta-barrel protein [Bacteroidota bacterium]
MKKITIILALAFISSKFISAQLNYESLNEALHNDSQLSYKYNNKYFKLGLGYGLSNISNYYIKDKTGNNVHISGLYFYKPKCAMGFQVSLNFMDYQTEEDNYINSNEYKNFHIMGQHLFLFGTNKIKPYAQFGYGFSLGELREKATYNGPTTNTYNYYYPEEYSSNTVNGELYLFNLSTGIGLMYDVSDIISLNLDTRYIMGYTYVPFVSDDSEIFSGFLSIAIDVMFKL